jgi:hypothetical protein
MPWPTMRDTPAGNAPLVEIPLELSGRIRSRRESMVIGRSSDGLWIPKSPSSRDRYNLGPANLSALNSKSPDGSRPEAPRPYSEYARIRRTHLRM